MPMAIPLSTEQLSIVGQQPQQQTQSQYVCKFCGKRYAYASSLYVHTRNHTNERPFKCRYVRSLNQFRLIDKIFSATRRLRIRATWWFITEFTQARSRMFRSNEFKSYPWHLDSPAQPAESRMLRRSVSRSTWSSAAMASIISLCQLLRSLPLVNHLNHLSTLTLIPTPPTAHCHEGTRLLFQAMHSNVTLKNELKSLHKSKFQQLLSELTVWPCMEQLQALTTPMLSCNHWLLLLLAAPTANSLSQQVCLATRIIRCSTGSDFMEYQPQNYRFHRWTSVRSRHRNLLFIWRSLCPKPAQHSMPQSRNLLCCLECLWAGAIYQCRLLYQLRLYRSADCLLSASPLLHQAYWTRNFWLSR